MIPAGRSFTVDLVRNCGPIRIAIAVWTHDVIADARTVNCPKGQVLSGLAQPVVAVDLDDLLTSHQKLHRRMASPKSSPRNHFCYNSLTISI
jgi:hypothetical protein